MRINFTALNKDMDLVFKATQNIIDSLEISQRNTTRDIIKQVADQTGIKTSIVTGLVALYLQYNQEVKLRSGRDGGAYKIAPPEGSQEVDLKECESCHTTVASPAAI